LAYKPFGFGMALVGGDCMGAVFTGAILMSRHKFHLARQETASPTLRERLADRVRATKAQRAAQRNTAAALVIQRNLVDKLFDLHEAETDPAKAAGLLAKACRESRIYWRLMGVDL
jgi:hypothetical protein